MRRKITFALFCFLGFCAVPSSAIAFGMIKGSGDIRRYPPELEARAEVLEKSYDETTEDNLARQAWAGTLCKHHPCAGEVTEAQANELLRDYQARVQRASDRQLSWIGIGLSLLSALAAVYALRQTHLSNETARQADARSLRSEARLDQIKES